MSLHLVAFEVEQLRGFRHARLEMDRAVTLLVGGNNAGKTSLLRLLEWAFEADESLFVPGGRGRPLNVDEATLLLPARNAQGAARRLSLYVKFDDGRRSRPYRAVGRVARLRFKVVDDRAYLKLGKPRQSEKRASDSEAVELWRKLRAAIDVVHIPAARDAASNRFSETLMSAVVGRLRTGATHQGRGGSKLAARTVGEALSTLGGLAENLTGPLWNDVAPELPSGLAADGGFAFNGTSHDLVDWLARHVDLRITTGDHDPNRVGPIELGAGLQSLLDLALLMPRADGKHLVLAIEEPEAFLHPSAQRAVARKLLEEKPGVAKIISTHSPVVVDEASYGAVVLVKGHRIYHPAQLDDPDRDEINTALLTDQGAEAIFSESVLLVEGPGDKLFFETLRRRLARVDPSGCLERASVVVSGGKNRFAPWIKLFESYASGDQRPIAWMILGDGDAVPAIKDALESCGVATTVTSARLQSAIAARGAQDPAAKAAAIDALNPDLLASSVPCHFLPVDLETSALALAGSDLVTRVAHLVGCSPTIETVLDRLASRKDPYCRAKIAATMTWEEVGSDVQDVLRRWFAGVMPPSEAKKFIGGVMTLDQL